MTASIKFEELNGITHDLFEDARNALKKDGQYEVINKMNKEISDTAKKLGGLNDITYINAFVLIHKYIEVIEVEQSVK